MAARDGAALHMGNNNGTPLLGPVEYVVLGAVAAASGPIGSRAITACVRSQGFSLSESTVSRILRRLDSARLTVPMSGKGRVLTAVGHSRLDAAQARAASSVQQTAAMDVRTLQELLDLLTARRAVECEAALDAANRASDEDVETLRGILELHRSQLSKGEVAMQPGLEFHRVIGRASGNRILLALIAMLLDARMDRIEAMLDLILGMNHTEEVGLAEHGKILDAIAARDSRRAEAAMHAHMTRLIDETARHCGSDMAEVVERMLAWARSDDPTR